MGNEREVRDEGKGDSRVGFKMANVQTHGEPAKVDVPCENGERGCRKAAAFSEAMSEKVADGDRPAEEGQVTEGHKELMEMGRPKSLPYKGPEVVMERSIEARAPDRGLGVSGELEREMIGSQMGSRSPAVNLTEFTNEALLEDPNGESVAMAGVFNQSSSSNEVGGAVMGPLRMIWADEREAEVLEMAGREAGVFGEKSEGVTDRILHEDMEEREEEGEPCWQSSSLAKFSRYIGMPTEGFEREILLLLKRMKERKIQKGKLDRKKRKKLKSSKFERELRKLEWIVNYIGEEGGEEGETKIQDMSKGIIRSLGVGRYLDWGAVDSRGAVGGIVVFWDNRVLDLVDIQKGDFNAILSPKERNRGGSLNSNMRRFLEIIEDLELKDVPLVGGPFTWNGGVNNQTFLRLDRGCEKRPFPFRFENMWLKVEGVKELMKSWWEGIELRKNAALEQVQFWDAKEKISRLNLEELEAREDYKKWVLLEEINWGKNLGNSGDWRPSISGLQLETLDQLDASTLESPFTEEEVFNALLSCNGDKAPGPDGFSMAFWQFAWDFVKADVLLGAEDLGDFRPISLVGSLYKWLAKVLANRLKKVVGKVISKAQGAFVEGRQILDAMLIANEAIDSTLKNNESVILCKLDIEKAYDNVDWTFILTVMQKMGFGEKWIRWIKWCISTASFSVLVNGTPTGFFQSSKGLRQGDPFSPYLFVIAMEVFSVFLKRAVEGGYLSGCRVKGRSEEGVLISHLLFADDTLVFCNPSQDHLTYLSWLLMWFEATSGLRINLEKSELIPVGRVENMDDLAWEFGCKVGSLPSTYLGMPLGASFKSTSVWDGVEDRFRKRLVKRRLEKIQRDFLWGGGNLERKPHLVRWEVVCLMIRGKYEEERGGWSSREVREAHGLGLWKGIRMDWELVSNRLVFIVGNGRREESVADVWDSLAEGGWGGWNPCFLRAFNDWEVEEASSFMERLHRNRVIEDVEDMVSWTETKSGKFSVKSLYLALEAGCSTRFPSSLIWNENVQPKISFFAWEATWGKALTLDKVQKRGWALANRCFLCLENE
ncbi:LINE-1 reverse transcriptase-like [Vitis vinifera]|uniref:LINE-1 reverse transcriptase-like n=1 Tax=Vitis vinifera TaxID=29760 RepID=A0A438FE26_VITVI|nr:LINE-1 reverse transcriptase-like [Vitis vinifera]